LNRKPKNLQIIDEDAVINKQMATSGKNWNTWSGPNYFTNVREGKSSAEWGNGDGTKMAE